MMQEKNILILIDVWDNLNDPLEVTAIQHIIKFIKSVRDLPNWHIYSNNSDKQINSSIQEELSICKNVNYVNSVTEIHIKEDEFVTFYFGGFHTNLCLFQNPIGLNYVLTFFPRREYDYFFVTELTCGLIHGVDSTQRVRPTDLPCYPPDKRINYYKKEIIESNLISVNDIELIDVWDNLNDPLEVTAIQHIIKFIKSVGINFTDKISKST